MGILLPANMLTQAKLSSDDRHQLDNFEDGEEEPQWWMEILCEHEKTRFRACK